MRQNILILNVIGILKIQIDLPILIIHILLNLVIIPIFQMKNNQMKKMMKMKIMMMTVNMISMTMKMIAIWMKRLIIWRNKGSNSRETKKKEKIEKILMKIVIPIRLLLIVKNLIMKNLKRIFKLFWLNNKSCKWNRRITRISIMIMISEI